MNTFNAKKTKNELVNWIRNWFNENGKDCNAVIGISGGKDSSVVAALCVEALGKDRVIGVLMPNGVQKDIDKSKELVDFLKIKNKTVNIEAAYNGLIKQFDFEPSEQTLTNLAPRLRMAALYAVSQSHNGRVSNNCNLSENYVGYSTKFGDEAGDFSPLAHLTVSEVKAIGYELNLPVDLIEKTPSDGLTNKTDEDNFGFSYDALDKYIREGICEDADVKEKIDNRHNKNKFKLEPMASFYAEETNE